MCVSKTRYGKQQCDAVSKYTCLVLGWMDSCQRVSESEGWAAPFKTTQCALSRSSALVLI